MDGTARGLGFHLPRLLMRILCEQVNINIYISEGLGKNPTALSTNSLFYNFFVVSSFLLKRHAYEFLAFIFFKTHWSVEVCNVHAYRGV